MNPDGPVFVGDVEYGKETAQIGRVIQLMSELGLKFTVDVPDSTEPYLAKIRKKNGLIRPSQRKVLEAEINETPTICLD